MPQDQVKVFKRMLPTRDRQEKWHREIEKYFASRGRPVTIFRLMGRWEIVDKKK